MARKIKSSQQDKDYYKKKRNKILFFILLPPIVFSILWVLLYNILEFDINILMSIYLFLMIGYIVYIGLFRESLQYYNMYHQYHAIIENQIGPLSVKGSLFTPSWLKQFTTDGFVQIKDTEDYIIFQQVKSKLQIITSSHYTMIAIVVAKHEKTDFFSDDIQKDIQLGIEKNPSKDRIKAQIILQFKRYEQLDESAKNEIIQVINFKSIAQTLVHLTIGYIHDKHIAYFLCPAKKFPNKYYYYACKLAQMYSKTDEGSL